MVRPGKRGATGQGRARSRMSGRNVARIQCCQFQCPVANVGGLGHWELELETGNTSTLATFAGSACCGTRPLLPDIHFYVNRLGFRIVEFVRDRFKMFRFEKAVRPLSAE